MGSSNAWGRPEPPAAGIRAGSVEDLPFETAVTGPARKMVVASVPQPAVFEGECWRGILTRHCPDKRIDNYPGAPKGIVAKDLAGLLADGAHEAYREIRSPYWKT